MNFYTNVFQSKNKIYVRGVKDGKPYAAVDDYKPYLFLPTKNESEYKTLDGKPVRKKLFSSIREAKDFLSRYEDVEDMKIYGMTNFLYSWIYDNFHDEIQYDVKNISVASLDIETSMKHEFDVELAMNEITAITVGCKGVYYTLGIKDFTPTKQNHKYFKCKDEADLLQRFITLWEKINADIVTGWNVEFFDIPYIINRMKRILGEDSPKKLSPWGLLHPYEIEIRGRTVTSYTMVGTTVLDYMELYKKFNLEPRESYKLDHIAEVELDEKKLDYSEYDGLDDLYERNFQKYIEYNLHDVILVDRLDAKLKMIELVLYLAYDAKVNYQDALATVKPWDAIIHSYLLDQKIVIPPVRRNTQSSLVGGFVKDVVKGMYKWVVSFDLTSLYPHIIMGWNISPETFAGRLSSFFTIDQLLEKPNVNTNGYAVTANGCQYRRDIRGFLPDLMEQKFNRRSTLKKQMLELKKEYERTKDESLQSRITQLDNAQNAVKIQINSAYGALANIWFRWYDLNHAEAITTTGQLAIRWISDRINEYLNNLFKTTNVDYVIANDTDSAYITLEALVNKLLPNETDNFKVARFLGEFCKTKLQPFIDKSYHDLDDMMNAYDHMLKMKLEAVASTSVHIAPKNYLMYVYSSEGVVYNKPKLKVVGIKAAKASTPAKCRTSIKSVLETMLSKDESAVQREIAEFRDVFMKLPFEDIAFPRGVSNISDWYVTDVRSPKSKTPINVKGALLYNQLLKSKNITNKYEAISNGDKIRFCYLKTPNPWGVNVIAAPDRLPKEFAAETYLNRELQFEKTYLTPLDNILQAIGWSAEKKASLSSFFN